MVDPKEDNMFQDLDTTSIEEINVETPTGGAFDLSRASMKSANDSVKVERIHMDGMEVGITKVELRKPSLVTLDGTRIEPQKSQSGKSFYYPVRLGVFFDHENQREFLPGAKLFVRPDGTIQDFPSIQHNGDSEVSKLFQMVAEKLGKDPADLSLFEFFQFFETKPRVKIKEVSGTHMGTKWFANRIEKIL